MTAKQFLLTLALALALSLAAMAWPFVRRRWLARLERRRRKNMIRFGLDR
jgi:hypothetical protein